MNPTEAKLVIAKLIEEHGPDCSFPSHYLATQSGKPAFYHDGQGESGGARFVCRVYKGGMKNGFTVELWDVMGDLLSKAVNDRKVG